MFVVMTILALVIVVVCVVVELATSIVNDISKE